MINNIKNISRILRCSPGLLSIKACLAWNILDRASTTLKFPVEMQTACGTFSLTGEQWMPSSVPPIRDTLPQASLHSAGGEQWMPSTVPPIRDTLPQASLHSGGELECPTSAVSPCITRSKSVLTAFILIHMVSHSFSTIYSQTQDERCSRWNWKVLNSILYNNKIVF